MSQERTPRDDARALVERWAQWSNKVAPQSRVPRLNLNKNTKIRMVEDLATLINDWIRRAKGDYSA